MTLQDFKLKMISELSSIYEMDELNSIFNLLSEDYLKISRSKILLANEIDLNESNQTLFLGALERLKTHEPIQYVFCLLYTSPSPRDSGKSRMPYSA